ncbi:MAG: mechanosensitive ion channel domain-containing protein [Cyanobium sp.]
MNPAFSPAVTAGQVGWVSVLIFGFPVAMVLLGEAIRRLQRRRHPVLPAVRILRNWIIPSLTVFVLLAQVIGLPRSTVLVRVAETLVWITLIYGALTLLNAILFEGAAEGSWQAKVPQLFRDLGRSVLVLVGSSIVLSTVWGADLGGFLTALGVGSLVLGLALQDSLGNIFSGVALLFEQPIRLGDWIEIGDHQGRVVEVNWRAVHLLTSDNNLVVVPNSELGKTSFTNMSRPEMSYIQPLHLTFALDDPPNTVKEVLESTALEMGGVLADPPPKATLSSYNDSSVSYLLEVVCPSYEEAGDLADALLTRLWYASRRQGLTMPYPVRMTVPYQPAVERLPETTQRDRLEVLRESCFAALPQEGLKRLASRCLVREYGAGEVVLQQGTPLTSLFLILAGEAELLVSIRGGASAIGILSPGEVFAEEVILLHNRVATTTARSAGDLRVMVIDAATLNGLIDAHPRLGTDLKNVMNIRRRAVEALLRETEEGEQNPAPQGEAVKL